MESGQKIRVQNMGKEGDCFKVEMSHRHCNIMTRRTKLVNKAPLDLREIIMQSN